MGNWLDFYANEVLHRPLEPEDYIFPTISTNGIVHPHQHITSEVVQKEINEFAAAADITGAGYFTTHCFRRGGAQYRFMFAQIGERWTLARIRWWGGWAEGEHVSILLTLFIGFSHGSSSGTH
jgi:integrase